jgi:molybdate transport system ATP-binding protein
MSLEVSATVSDRGFELSMHVGVGETLAVLGPNGSGKSTAMSVIAGLLRPDAGTASLDDRTLFSIGTPGKSDVWVPPHDRGVALLAQEPLLFPHLSSLDNVAFGPRSLGQTRSKSRTLAEHWLDQVDAAQYADRRPAQLSGGQAQRIAVARALAADPRLLLLDEPMAALDVAVAPAIRQLLRQVLKDRSAVIVTHDVLDALLLADRVLVVEGGHVVEEGPTADLLARPRSAFAARIAGLNMVRGTLDGHAVRGPDGFLVEGIADQPIGQGDPAVAVFRPSAVGVYRQPPGGSPRNVMDVTVTELEPFGDQIRVRTDRLSADVTATAVAELDLSPGTEVVFTVKASEVAIYRS